MLNLSVLSVMKILVYSKTCNELSPRIVNTYLASDSNIFYNEGSKLIRSIEVSCDAWVTIPNTSWIWKTSNFEILEQTIVEFSKSFFVPGRVISGIIEYFVDNNLIELKINGQIADFIISGTHYIKSQVNIASLLVSGMNNFSATVENIQYHTYNPGGFDFLINITSQVLV